MDERPHPSLLRSMFVVGVNTALSRVLGVVREILMAVYFGTTLAKSAFDVAFLVPNLFRRLFGEGALSAAFVPVFTRTMEKEGPAGAGEVAGRTLTLLAAILGAATAVGILLATAAMHWLPLGERAAAVLPLLRIMLPYMFYICLAAICMGILNCFHRFAVPAFTPVLLNVAWIGAIVFAAPRFGARPEERIFGVAWGILAAGALQLLLQVPAFLRLGFRPPVSWEWRDARVRRVLVLMGPVAVGMGVSQVNVLLDRLMALFAAPWAPAALTYAERLVYLPLGMIATALGTVLLPTFSRQAAQDDRALMRETLGQALRNLMLVMVPAAVGLMVLAEPVTRVVYVWRGGEFGPESTLRTARALAFYAPGLVAFSLYKILVPAFYALQDTRTPVLVGLGAVALNLALNIAFVITWPLEFKHAGLALATVIASAVNGAVLARLLDRRLGSPGWGRIAGTALRALGASLVMAASAVAVHRGLGRLLPRIGVAGKPAEAAALAGAMAAGAIVYAAAAAVLCRREVRECRTRLRRRRPVER